MSRKTLSESSTSAEIPLRARYWRWPKAPFQLLLSRITVEIRGYAEPTSLSLQTTEAQQMRFFLPLND
jgi:hypothetical protein